MGRGKKNRDTTLTPGWQDAVDASEAHDDEARLAGTGVVHEGGGPVHMVKLTEDQHREVGDKLAATLVRIEELKAEKKQALKDFKEDITDLEDRRDVLRDEWRSGVRKEGAQPALPGVDA